MIPDNSNNNNLFKTKLNYALAFFTIGGIIQIITFYISQDFEKSVGIGYGLYLASITLLC